jgi:Do/DeqQ family serine protease
MKRALLILTVILSALIGAVLGILFTVRYLDVTPSYVSIEDHQKPRSVNYRADSSFANVPSVGLNFEAAAQLITPAVVHIRTIYGPGNFSLNPLERYSNPEAQSTGSGVILSDDGFIVTNYHVIEGANTIEIVMNNNQRFFARLVGADPTTDLALLKIKVKGLPFVKYGDSDAITPGQWVLAVGNPFDLNSTVTAGIVSAKARNIGILHDRNNLQIESFIQTDAAVNPGNSGGALVNLKGELIGINSAIATATGGYAGYSFAIPVSLVKKIMDDLLEFGEVQRGLLGIRIEDVTADRAEKRHLDVISGVYISGVNKGGAADAAGIEQGDVITAINKHRVSNMSELQEWVARNRPGQGVSVTYRRNGHEFQVKAKLKNFEGSEQLKKKEVEYEIAGAVFEELNYKELTRLSLDGGVLISKLEDGKWKKAGVREEFIVTHIDKIPIDHVADLNRILELKQGGILVEGVYRAGEKATYGVVW